MYIRLNKNGAPVTCIEHQKMLFEEIKAKNILDNLPITLRRLNFKIEAIDDNFPKLSDTDVLVEKK